MRQSGSTILENISLSKEFLDKQVELFCNERALYAHPDPLQVARRHKNGKIALVCALFAYGNASQIVRFLESLDFSLLQREEDEIKTSIHSYYRFQKSLDVAQFFITLGRAGSLEEVFMEAYKKGGVVAGVDRLIEYLYSLNPYRSYGYNFLIGKPRSSSAMKRWHMYLRWMVRKDGIDLGLWKRVNRADLLIPLDTHTFSTARKLGLLKRKTPDLKAAIELTNRLKEFDPEDPVRYDFALYRLGQLNLA